MRYQEAGGVPVVWAGQEDGPALVVIDATGAAASEGLPATWARLAEHFQVAWCRTPVGEHSLEDIEDVLETLSDRKAPASVIVASGDACPPAIAIARQFADIVNAVLLVDPVGDDTATLADTDVEVRVIARSDPGQGEPPMSLARPEVVESLVIALAGMR